MHLGCSCSLSSCTGNLSGSLLWALLFTAQSRCENPHPEISCSIQLWIWGSLGILSHVYVGNTSMCLTISKAKRYRKCVPQQQMYVNFKNVLKLIVKLWFSVSFPSKSQWNALTEAGNFAEKLNGQLWHWRFPCYANTGARIQVTQLFGMWTLCCNAFAFPVTLELCLPLSVLLSHGAALQGAEGDAGHWGHHTQPEGATSGWLCPAPLSWAPHPWLEHCSCISKHIFLSLFVSSSWINAEWAGMRGGWLQRCISDLTEMCVDTSSGAQQSSSVQDCPPAMCRTHLEGGRCCSAFVGVPECGVLVGWLP